MAKLPIWAKRPAKDAYATNKGWVRDRGRYGEELLVGRKGLVERLAAIGLDIYGQPTGSTPAPVKEEPKAAEEPVAEVVETAVEEEKTEEPVAEEKAEEKPKKTRGRKKKSEDTDSE